MTRKNKKTCKKLLSLLLVALTIFGIAIPITGSFAPPVVAEAATISADAYREMAALVNRLGPIEAYPITRNSRAYAYSDSTLRYCQPAYYIDCFEERVVILEMSSNGEAVLLGYLSSKGQPRRKWFRTRDVFNLNSVQVMSTIPTGSISVFRVSSSTTSMRTAQGIRDYGTIYAGDPVYVVGTYKIQSRNAYATIYSLTNKKTVNGISNVRYKFGLCNALVIQGTNYNP